MNTKNPCHNHQYFSQTVGDNRGRTEPKDLHVNIAKFSVWNFMEILTLTENIYVKHLKVMIHSLPKPRFPWSEGTHVSYL